MLSRALLLVAAFSGAASAQPTFTREVSRILQEKCQTCHRQGDIAPFTLTSYDDVLAVGARMRVAVDSGEMPPWKPAPGHGDFKGNLSLSDEQRKTILDWIDAGMPQGDP